MLAPVGTLPAIPSSANVGTVGDTEQNIQIVYHGIGGNPGNYSEFVFDGLGRNVKIVEYSSNIATSTKQFVWCQDERCEERDGAGSLVTYLFRLGEKVSGTSYFFAKDHLGSIREMTNSSGIIQAAYSYDPYGVSNRSIGTVDADFQYSGYYAHGRSGLNFTRTRAYSAVLGRFLGRDSIGELGGINLFAYANNQPISMVDPTGNAPEEFVRIPITLPIKPTHYKVVSGESLIAAAQEAVSNNNGKGQCCIDKFFDDKDDCSYSLTVRAWQFCMFTAYHNLLICLQKEGNNIQLIWDTAGDLDSGNTIKPDSSSRWEDIKIQMDALRKGRRSR